jgi:hypothetical protein
MSSNGAKVGYRQPPREHQFQPGQSGNPTGKAKGLRSIAKEMQDILSEQITLSEGGTTKTMSKQKALASALISAAISGDLRATAIVMSHLSREGQNSPDEEQQTNADDFSAVQEHRKREGK